jgi:heat shock protein HslJ
MVNARFLGMLILWAAPVLALAGAMDKTALDGVTWRLTQVAQTDGALHPVPDSIEATATFANGAISGSSGCNRYTTSYTVNNGKLTIGLAAATMMACPEPQAVIEQSLMAALAATRAYKIEDGQLIWLDAEGQKIATFKAQQPTALKGVTWRATVYNNGRGAAVSLIDGSEITAVFGADGTLSGSAGCNHYRTTYVTQESAITIQAAATTRKTCPEPDGVMQQESEYLKALTTAATYAIQGQQLELRTADDALVALFQASGD